MANYQWNDLTDAVNDIYFSDPSKVVQHQINSYNYFVETIVPNVIFRQSPIVVGTLWDEARGDYAKKYVVEFTKVSMCAPMQRDGPNDPIRPLYPYEARMRNLTYAAQMYVDIKHSYYSGIDNEPETELEQNIPICKLPVMLRSNYCNLKINNTDLHGMNESVLDYGGYFIVNGNEKVLIGQERMAENNIFCFEPKRDASSIICEIKSTKDQLYFPVKNVTVEMVSDIKTIDYSGNFTVNVNIPMIKESIPLFIVFRALGIENDKDIFDIIVKKPLEQAENFMLNVIEYSALKIYEENEGAVTQNDALLFIGNHLNYNINYLMEEGENVETVNNERRLAHIAGVLNRDFLPHLGTDNYKKALYLGYMVRYMIECYTGKRNYDNRDNIQNKRVDLAGLLLTQLFRTQFLNLVRDIKIEISKVEGLNPSLRRIIQSSSIGQKIKFGLSTGNWSSVKGSSAPQSKKGIAQVLSRLSYLGTICHLRRNISPLEHSGSKLDKPRKIYASHTGYICPNETPEGGQVGIVKNLSQSCEVTLPTNASPIKMILEAEGMTPIYNVPFENLKNCIYVFVNGELVGFVDDETAPVIYESLIVKKRHGEISIYTSLKWRVEHDEILIFTDGGRYTRPLFVVEDGAILAEQRNIKNSQWNDLLFADKAVFEKTRSNGAVIEYIDAVALEKTLIALNKGYLNQAGKSTYLDYTHCEIDPNLWLGIIAGCIPASDHNPSPRNCYQSSMGKQAIGIYSADYNLRMDSNVFILGYPQKPLVSTKTMRYIGFDRVPHGSQVILAICTYGGYNQEDSLSINRSAIQRGLFNTIFFRTYQTDENINKTHNSEKICKPNIVDTKLMAPADSYKYLENNGIASIGSFVQGGDTIIGKTVTTKSKYSNAKNIDASVMLRKTEKGIVDRVIPNEQEPISINADGNKLVKVRVVDYREPILADKFASRHAQKGTVGMIYNEVDMPFTGDGIIPDFIMNPHAIPSRMTVGQILETLLGKVGSVIGKEMDATTFSKIDTETLFKYMREYGFDEQCEEVMYNGMTGLQMNSTIFIGPTYYQRLKHMVEDKIHSRISGQVHMTTRQPTEGRSRDGGLRLGEMERDAMLAHGAVQFLKERFMDASDIFKIYVSKTEQSMVVANPDENIYIYGGKNIPKDDVVEIQLPYAMKLLLHEMNAMGIDARIIV